MNNNDESDVLLNLSRQTSAIIGNLNIQIAQLEVENQKLRNKNAELDSLNANLRKNKGANTNELINNHTSNK